MFYKGRRLDLPEFNDHDMKLAGAKASDAVVNISAYDILDLPWQWQDSSTVYASGIIIECQSSSEGGNYLCTALAPASIFSRPYGVDRYAIHVQRPDKSYYRGDLLACDFHYNLAAIRFKSTSPLPTAILKHMDDTFSIDITHHFPEMPFQLQSPSNIYNIVPGSEVFSVCLSHVRPYSLYSGSGFFSSRCPKGGELYEIKDIQYEIKDCIECPVSDGESVLNSFGEIIGIIFNRSSFLPSNVMTRWWNHYKTFKEFRRPFLGIEVDNLYHADINFLVQFVTRFPDISTAVIITKVEEGSRACWVGIRTNDVIIKLDGKLVKSKSQYFETIWEKVGKSVEFSILRVLDGTELNLNLVIEEVNPDKLPKLPVCLENRS